MIVTEIAAFLLSISLDIPFSSLVQEAEKQEIEQADSSSQIEANGEFNETDNKSENMSEIEEYLLAKEAYLVGPGDTLTIDVWAGQSKEETLGANLSFLISLVSQRFQ